MTSQQIAYLLETVEVSEIDENLAELAMVLEEENDLDHVFPNHDQNVFEVVDDDDIDLFDYV